MSSHTNRNFILAYILLVGLPIVGLLGVLRSGRKLTPPISVDGLWHLQADPDRLASLPCGNALASSPDTALAISQSGKNFTLTLANGPKSTSSGELDGTALKASIAPSPEWSAQAGCGSDRELALVATVDPKSEPRSLSGTLSVNNCSSCGAVEIRAVKQTPPAKRVGH
jgi:hypothetical protein